MTLLLRIAERTLNRPLLIHPQKAHVIAEVLAGRIGIEMAGPQPDASRFEGEAFERDTMGRPVRGLPYRVSEGIGIVSVVGSLVNRGAWIGANSGLVSYEGVKYQLQSAAADPNVSAIVLDLESPGGEAVGAFEMAAAVRQVAKSKPVVAVVNGMAASAAYAIASGATRIVTTETGVSGSIGVVLLHADFSKQLETKGVKPTLIFAGAHKVDGNPYEPLSADVRADLQAEVDSFYAKFLDTVAAGRGKRLSAKAARATEARTFIGLEAVNAGLADELGTFESALAALKAERRAAARISVKGKTMSDENAPPAATAPGYTQADLDRARAEGKSEGAREGVAAYQARRREILGLAEAKGREALAEVLIDNAAMSVEQVKAALAAAPSAQPAQAVTQTLSPEAHAQARAAAAGLATPSAPASRPAAGLNPTSIYEARRQAVQKEA